MLYWILGFCVIVFLFSCYQVWKNDYDVFYVLTIVFAIAGIIVFGIICFFKVDVKGGHIIENKIEMYEEENAEIETEITALVNTYMAFEKATFENLKVEGDIVALVSLYPELKSDELVQAQITLYTSNQKKIIKLKEELIDLDKKRIWLGMDILS